MGALLNYPRFKAWADDGTVLNGGKLYTYAAGTNTAKAAYTDIGTTTAHANPIILDPNGEAMIYLLGTYKLVLKDSAEVQLWEEDNISGGEGSTAVTSYYADYNIADHGSAGIADMLTTIGSTNKATIVLPHNESAEFTDYHFTTDGNFGTYDNVVFFPQPGARITVATGVTVTFPSPAHIPCLKSSPTQQVFSLTGTGVVAFAQDGEIYPNAFLENATPGTTDVSSAVQAALNLANAANTSIKVKLLPQRYYLGTTGLAVYEDTTIEGTQWSHQGQGTELITGSVLSYDGSGACITGDGTGTEIMRNVNLKDFSINLGHASASTGIYLNWCTLFTIENIGIDEGYDYGLRFESCHHGRVDNVRVTMHEDNGIGCDWNVEVADPVFSGQTLFTRCEFHEGATGIHVDVDANIIAQLVFLACHTRSNTTNVDVEKVARMSLIDHHFESGETRDLHVQSTVLRGLTVSGCYANNGVATGYRFLIEGNYTDIKDINFISSAPCLDIRGTGTRVARCSFNTDSITKPIRIHPNADNTTLEGPFEFHTSIVGWHLWEPWMVTLNDSDYSWTVSGSGTNEYYMRLSGDTDPGYNTPVTVVHVDDTSHIGTALTEGTVGSLAVGEWDYGDNDTLGYSTIYVRLPAGATNVDPDLCTEGEVRGGWQAARITNEIYYHTRVFDLSAAAAEYDDWWSNNKYWIKDIQLAYTEASSADAGITFEIGIDGDADRFMTMTTEVSLGRGTARWYFPAIDAPVSEYLAPYKRLQVHNAGGKTGTGEIKAIIRMLPFDWYIA